MQHANVFHLRARAHDTMLLLRPCMHGGHGTLAPICPSHPPE